MEILKEKDFIDVGSHIGDYVIAISSYTNRTVCAFELSPSQIDVIKTNIHLNNLDDKIQIVPKGLSNHHETLYLSDQKEH